MQGNQTILERHLAPAMHATLHRRRTDCEHASTRPGNTPSQRRSQRIFLCAGIIVHGQKSDGSAFSTKTEVVSAHGALILLREPVSTGQNLTLGNILTSEEVACTGRKQPGTSGSCRSWGTVCPPEPKILARRVSTIRLEFEQSGNQKIQYPKRQSTQNQQIRSRILAAAPARPARPMGRGSV
jgi:hypothetical protein